MMKFEPLTTEHDLSAGTVKIDYKALISVSQYALYSTTRSMLHQAAEIRDREVDGTSSTAVYLTARQMQHTARTITEAAETVHALVEGLKRDDKIFINIPEGV